MNLPQLLVISFIKQDQRMKVSISRMEYVCDGKVILLANLHHLGQNFRKFCSGNGPITDEIVWTKPGNRPESSFPTRPELGSLGLSFCGLDLSDIVFPADLHDPFSQPLHPILQSIELDDQDRFGIEWKPCMDGLLHRFA